MPSLFPYRNLHRVYCAGPLFNAAERREMVEIAGVLARGGFETFVPHADGMEFALVQPYLVERGFDAARIGELLHRAIFALDTYQVAVGCGAMVFNMNGRVPDEGAVAEATIAWMLDKPVVLFKEDARSAIAGRDNPLVVGPADFQMTDDIERLPELLAERILAAGLQADAEVACSNHFDQTVTAGERLWQALDALGPVRSVEPVAEVVLELFAPPAGAAPLAERFAFSAPRLRRG
jgi:nucleoside 2-deoxyribosyltransferase